MNWKKLLIYVLIFIISILCGMLIYGKTHPCKDWDTEQHCHTEKICSGGIPIPGLCHYRENTICSTGYTCLER